MTDAGERWYVVQSQPNAELKAAAHLNRQGFATYLPRYVKRRRHARRVEHVPVPLFPRYLFVGIDMTTQRWRSIVSTVGVSRLICSGEAPQAVPDQIVASLRARGWSWPRPPRPPAKFPLRRQDSRSRRCSRGLLRPL